MFAAFTCIPAILTEYRTAELNVRTGCLKALTFVFEYVGPQSAYYADSVVTMLEDALTDRDHVHRQTASTIVKHLALGVAGLGCEDSMLHLMNLVWPNCFETSPHVIGAVMEAIEAMRVCLGPSILLNYTLQGLFHPARKVREVRETLFSFQGIADSTCRCIGVFTMLSTSVLLMQWCHTTLTSASSTTVMGRCEMCMIVTSWRCGSSRSPCNTLPQNM
jgi:hypothetical protein